MKIIVSTNQKGGVGKTAIAVHLCFYLAKKGKRVLFVDLDPQANASKTLQQGAAGEYSYDLFAGKMIIKDSGHRLGEDSTGGWTILSADARIHNVYKFSKQEAYTNFKENIRAVEDDYDYVIIDTPPTQEFTMLAALYVAGYAFCPIIPEGYSIDGITKMLQVMYGISQQLNPELKFLGMIPSKVRGTSTAHKAAITALYKQYPQYMLCAEDGGLVGITERQAVAEALDAQKPVWDLIKKSNDGAASATKDFTRVFEAILHKMNSQNHNNHNQGTENEQRQS